MSHEIGAGDVALTLGRPGEEQDVVLRPTLKAATTLAGARGGITTMVQRCLDMEFNAIVDVITAGIGSSSKDLPELVFQTGLIDLSPTCIKFLHVIANGGRPLSNDEEADEGKSPLDSSSP